MKRVNRAKLRGRLLDRDCKSAHTNTGEYGNDDRRVFCYGIIDAMNDKYLEKCKKCGAFIQNATPLEAE